MTEIDIFNTTIFYVSNSSIMDADDTAYVANVPEETLVDLVDDVGKGDDGSSDDTSSATERGDNDELSVKGLENIQLRLSHLTISPCNSG